MYEPEIYIEKYPQTVSVKKNIITDNEINFWQAISSNIRAHADSTLAIEDGKNLSYQNFLAKAENYARALHALDVRSGDRIILASEYSADAFCLLVACARLGAIFVPLNWRLTVAEQSQIVADCEPAILVIAHDTIDAAELDVRSPAIRIEELEGHADCDLPPPPLHDQTLCIIYTAAVDGIPKGAMLSGANLVLASLQFAQKISLTPQDRLVGGLPVFHIFSFNLTLATIFSGGCILSIRRFDAEIIADLIARQDATIIGTFPPMLDRLLDCAERFDLSGLRAVVGIESAETINRLQHVSNAAFWTGFGQTETSGFVTFAQAHKHPGSAGFAGPLSQINLVRPLGAERPESGVGEIVVLGPLVMQGYWKRGSKTEISHSQGWYRTGDLGCFDEHGSLIYKGRTRTKQLIKSGGENVYPAEVEAAMISYSSIEECYVFGLPDAEWGELVCAVYTSRAPIDESALEIFLSRQIARYKRPRRMLRVDSIIRHPDGTVDHAKVIEQFVGSQD